MIHEKKLDSFMVKSFLLSLKNRAQKVTSSCMRSKKNVRANGRNFMRLIFVCMNSKTDQNNPNHPLTMR